MPSPAATEKLAALVARAGSDRAVVVTERALGDALALEVEGELGFAWRLQVIQGVVAASPQDDTVRELYGELVDRYRGDPARLVALRAIGDDIRRREIAGELPSSLVVRAARRRP